MKILHIIPSYKPAYIYGGVIESVARLCEGLVQAGHDVNVFTTTANGNAELGLLPGKPIDVNGVKVTYFKRITKDHTHISISLWRNLWVHLNEFDAVHIHSWWNPLVMIAALMCVMKNVRIIISPRGMLSTYIFTASRSFTKRMLHFSMGRLILKISTLHATADSEYKECRNLIPDWKGFVLPNILDLPEVSVARTTNPVFTLIFLSRIHPKKGIELLFQALAEIAFPVKLKIVGSGEDAYLERLRQYAQQLRIADKVDWLGWKDRNEKFIELAKSDCFILTSHNENFANVVIESLHVGTPVIISDRIGLAPFVKENNVGWVTPLTVDSIRGSIEEAFQNKDKCEFAIKHARSIVERSFAQSLLIAKYIEQYRAVAHRNKPGLSLSNHILLSEEN